MPPMAAVLRLQSPACSCLCKLLAFCRCLSLSKGRRHLVQLNAKVTPLKSIPPPHVCSMCSPMLSLMSAPLQRV